MLLITIASLGYAALNDSVDTIVDLQNAEYAIEITDCRVEAYNGLCYQLFWDEHGVSFNDSNIFPGWELVINITIHNIADLCQLNYTIYYWDGTAWIDTDEAELLSLFRIKYETKFYNATSGPDFGAEIQGNPVLDFCESVFKVEHLEFVASTDEFENLLGETFQIKIVVQAVPPTGG